MPNKKPLVDISKYISSDRVLFFKEHHDKNEALQELSHLTAENVAITNEKEFINAIFEREEVSSTGIGNGIAVPHTKLSSIDDFLITVGIAPDGIHYDAIDKKPVHFIIMIAANSKDRKKYLQVLASVAGILKDKTIYESLCNVKTGDDIVSIFKKACS